jgi:hypothetical protein
MTVSSNYSELGLQGETPGLTQKQCHFLTEICVCCSIYCYKAGLCHGLNLEIKNISDVPCTVYKSKEAFLDLKCTHSTL